MFSEFPKKRIKLPEQYKSIYKEHYKSNRAGTNKISFFTQKIESWLHKSVASDVSKNRYHDKSTLEVGAGTLNQLEYEKGARYDIVEPFFDLYRDSCFLKNIHNIYSDIDEIDLSEKYDRITSVATFEHILDLPKVVAKTCLLLADEGSLRTAIPNEGEFLWKLSYTLSSGIHFRLKYGLDYSLLMNYEHVNTAGEIESILNYFYRKNECRVYGLNKKLSLYRYYKSSNPNIERAIRYLERINLNP